jgi:hypothetical protein
MMVGKAAGPPTVINKRPYRAFLSHAHLDKKFVDGLYRWLSEIAGFRVWYDSFEFPNGLIAAELGKAVENCQAAILVLTEASVASGWVEEEWNICINEQKSVPDFQIVLLKLDDCKLPASLRVRKYIEIKGAEIDHETGSQIIEALHWHQTRPSEISRSTFYLSRGSRPAEYESSEAWLSPCRNAGFRFIRDSPDQFSFSEQRIKNIITGTSGIFAFVPNRGHGETSKYILDEIRFAKEVNVGAVVIADEGVPKALVDGVAGDKHLVLGIGTDSTDVINSRIQYFLEVAKPPMFASHCFLGHGFGNEQRSVWASAKRVIEVVSGLPCISGDNLIDDGAQRQIVDKISTSALAIFDISEDKLNTCIEAGIARGASVRYELVCKGPRRRPPFIFRDKQVFFYETTAELVGTIRKLVFDLRRVVN